MKLKRITTGLLAGSTCFFGAVLPSYAREDVLECQAIGGERFELRSSYRFDILGRILPHVQSEYDRSPWDVVRYIDKHGKLLNDGLEGVAIQYSAKDDLALQTACSRMAVIDGVPVLKRVFFENGRWESPQSVTSYGPFGTDRLLQKRESYEPQLSAKQEALARLILDAGYKYIGEFRAAKVNGRWVAELELKNVNSWNAPCDAVLQAVSEDRGATWAEARITKEADIFEIGYRLAESCRTTRPSRINGKRLEVKFPERCRALAPR